MTPERLTRSKMESFDPVMIAEVLDGFRAPVVGRGVWYVNHYLSVVVIQHNDSGEMPTIEFLDVAFTAFTTYCEFIYCGHCREHASEYTNENPLTELDPWVYSKWLYEFHKSANAHADKTSPEYADVMNYFTGVGRTSISPLNYAYELIEAGLWHYFFLLSSKSKSRAQVSYAYYLFLQAVPSLPRRQAVMLNEYMREFQFREALYDESIRAEVVCMSFFDWLYGAYERLNTADHIRIYPIEVLSHVYLNIGVCDKDCDK